MLSNLVVTQQKFVFIVDYIGWEQQSETIIKQWLKEQNQHTPICDFLKLSNEFHNNLNIINSSDLSAIITDKCNIILPPISAILLEYKCSHIFKLIHNLKTNTKIKQIFIWACVKNINKDFIIPYLKYMADIVVTLNNKTNLTILSRKMGGLVTKKNYNFAIENSEFHVTECRSGMVQKTPDVVSIKPETLGTFKIDLNEEELVARNTLVLPFEKHLTINSEMKESKIILEDDDYDEEDPDDDLDI